MTEEQSPEPTLSSGEYLRAIRLERGLDIPTLAGRTSLTEQTIECLENDDWLALPAMVYVRGYIRLICRELDLEPEDVITRLEREDVQLYQPISVVDDSSGWFARLWETKRPTLAWGFAVATVLLGLLTQILSTQSSADGSETEANRADITVEQDQR